jgi:hypothetical protein
VNTGASILILVEYSVHICKIREIYPKTNIGPTFLFADRNIAQEMSLAAGCSIKRRRDVLTSLKMALPGVSNSLLQPKLT